MMENTFTKWDDKLDVTTATELDDATDNSTEMSAVNITKASWSEITMEAGQIQTHALSSRNISRTKKCLK